MIEDAVRDGTVTEASMFVSLPAGIVGRIKDGARIGPGELSLSAKFTDAKIRTVGQLPPVKGASGIFRMEGMSFRTVLDAGTLEATPGPVSIAGTALTVADFSVLKPAGELAIDAKWRRRIGRRSRLDQPLADRPGVRARLGTRFGFCIRDSERRN